MDAAPAHDLGSAGKLKPVVWTWQARFMAEGVEGLLRDKARKQFCLWRYPDEITIFSSA
jgi:hypothetical protein